MLTELDCSRLIEARGNSNAWLRLARERYQFPAVAGFLNGNKDALRVLLGNGGLGYPDDIVKDPGFGSPSQLSARTDLLCWVINGKNSAFVSCLLTSY